MPTSTNDISHNLNLPQSMVGGKHDTIAQKQFITELGNLSVGRSIPSVVLSATRHIVTESAHREILLILPLVTNNFWTAVNDHFEPFRFSNDTDKHHTQQCLVWKLLIRLRATGGLQTGKTDTTRRRNAKAIINQISDLRKMLDEETGFNEGDEYTGLMTPNPWEVLQNTAIQFAHKLAPQPTGTPYTKFIGLNPHDHGIVSQLSLQDLLAVIEQRLQVDAKNDLSRHRQEQGRHRRFASNIANWFKTVSDENKDEIPEPKQAISETTAAILQAYYPEQPNMTINRPLG